MDELRMKGRLGFERMEVLPAAEFAKTALVRRLLVGNPAETKVI